MQSIRKIVQIALKIVKSTHNSDYTTTAQDIHTHLSSSREIIASNKDWTGINICIAYAGHSFLSELYCLHHIIIPALNCIFSNRKLYIIPHYIPLDCLKPNVCFSNSAYDIFNDYKQWTHKCTPFFIQFIGDSIGPLYVYKE